MVYYRTQCSGETWKNCTGHHIWTCDSVNVGEKVQKRTACKSFNTFRRKQRKHRCHAHCVIFYLKVSKSHPCQHTPPKHSYTFDLTPDIPPCTPPLRANKRNDPLIQSCRQRPATTTLPSEGHQNVLVNAYLCAATGRGGAELRGCLYCPNNRVVEGGG